MNASEKLLSDLARGFDAILGKACACGAHTKVGHTYGCPNAPVWHDDKKPEDFSSELQRESGEYAKAERKTLL